MSRRRVRRHGRKANPRSIPGKLIFIDETWVKTNMIRLRGRSPRGTRLIDKTPHGHWKTSTFIGGLRCDEVVAPAVFDGPINGETFLAFVERVLVLPFDRVIRSSWTTCLLYKVAGVKQAIEELGQTLRYLPAYSPIRTRSKCCSRNSKLGPTRHGREDSRGVVGRPGHRNPNGQQHRMRQLPFKHAGYFQST